jgi:hypothetical protein
MQSTRLLKLGLRSLSLLMLGIYAYAHNSRPANACVNGCTTFLNGVVSCNTGTNGKTDCTVNNSQCQISGSDC